MKVITTTKNIELTPALKNFVEKKFSALKKFIGKILVEVFVELEKETQHHKKGKIFLVKTQLSLPGRILTVWSREDDLFKAIVAAKDEMKLEIEKYKFRTIDKRRRQQRKIKREYVYFN